MNWQIKSSKCASGSLVDDHHDGASCATPHVPRRLSRAATISNNCDERLSFDVREDDLVALQALRVRARQFASVGVDGVAAVEDDFSAGRPRMSASPVVGRGRRAAEQNIDGVWRRAALAPVLASTAEMPEQADTSASDCEVTSSVGEPSFCPALAAQTVFQQEAAAAAAALALSSSFFAPATAAAATAAVAAAAAVASTGVCTDAELLTTESSATGCSSSNGGGALESSAQSSMTGGVSREAACGPERSCEIAGSQCPASMDAWLASFPCILTNFDTFLSRIAGKRVVMFLDYDGTLTPIVSNPDRAWLSSEMRAVVKTLGRTFPTAIISGRGRDKVQSFVQLDELFYAGSHGLDIKGPVIVTESGEQAEVLPLELEGSLLTTMACVREEAEAATAHIAGATVEDNKYSVSVHFRNCCPSDWNQVREAVDGIISAHPDVRLTRGRKVFEIRPQVDWDKGKALLHLMEALGLNDSDDVVPVYVGDDRTDEDAFRVLKGNGIGVLVSTVAKPTEAVYTLRDPDSVEQFLVQLAEWGRTSVQNAWHDTPQCLGWAASAAGPVPLKDARSAAQHVFFESTNSGDVADEDTLNLGSADDGSSSTDYRSNSADTRPPEAGVGAGVDSSPSGGHCALRSALPQVMKRTLSLSATAASDTTSPVQSEAAMERESGRSADRDRPDWTKAQTPPPATRRAWFGFGSSRTSKESSVEAAGCRP